MKNPSGLSFSYIVGYLTTYGAVALAVWAFSVTYQDPAIIMAASVLTVVSISVLVIVPPILLAMLRNSQRTSDYLKEILERQANDSNPSTVIR